MVIEKHAFRSRDIVAGNLALDFVNTVTGRNAMPRDWLDGYGALLEWARLCGCCSRGDLAALDRMATAGPERAKEALVNAKLLREALCSAAYAFVRGESADPTSRATIERFHRSAVQAAHFEWQAHLCRIVWTAEHSGLDLISHVITVQAMRLFGDVDVDRLRICAGDNCGWVFLDTSRGGRRRWCDMATCGNVAKARRHYSRIHSA